MSLFGTSGIRRVVDGGLLQLALKSGLAVGGASDRVVVGRDTRTSGEALEHAVTAGLLAAGSRVSDAGIVPTPTLAFASRNFSSGVMVTASHNPPEYNGIKLFNADGSSFDEAQQKQVEEVILSGSPPVAPWTEMETSHAYEGAVEEHIERILLDFPSAKSLKVVVDCGCGAASLVTPHLLRRMGCQVTALNCYPSGFFPRESEPAEASLGELMQVVRGLEADLGLAHDGDADRLVAVDDRGRLVPGDQLLVLLARSSGAKQVVTTVDASMVIEEMGFGVKRTKVGDSFVSVALKKEGGDFGGEPSGAWIFPGVSLCPDGIYAAARAVALAREQKLSALVDAIPRYPLLRGSVKGQVDMSLLGERLGALKGGTLSNTDGLRLGFGDGWLLVRPSGTEPRVRVTAEARSLARAQQLYESGLKIVQGALGGQP